MATYIVSAFNISVHLMFTRSQSTTFRAVHSVHFTVDLHLSKPLIMLLPFNLHLHCFQGQGHSYVTIPIVFPANHKQSFNQVRDRPHFHSITGIKAFHFDNSNLTIQSLTQISSLLTKPKARSGQIRFVHVIARLSGM